MLRFLRIASLLLCLHIAFVDADCTHSRGPSTIAANKRPNKPADFWCGTGWHLCNSWDGTCARDGYFCCDKRQYTCPNNYICCNGGSDGCCPKGTQCNPVTCICDK